MVVASPSIFRQNVSAYRQKLYFEQVACVPSVTRQSIVRRMPECRLPKQTTKWNAEGSRRRGRPKDTWRRTIQREMRLKNLREDDISNLAEDRTAWRSLVADLWTSWGLKRIKWNKKNSSSYCNWLCCLIL